MTEPRDENILNFLASTVESIRDRLGGVETRLDRIETRLDGVENGFDGLGSRFTGLENRFAGLENRFDGLETRFDGLETRFNGLDNRMEAGFTAVRGDIERVHLRLDSIERMLSARLDRVETEVSRLRSVVYLLVKERPELLRLLGETPLS